MRENSLSVQSQGSEPNLSVSVCLLVTKTQRLWQINQHKAADPLQIRSIRRLQAHKEILINRSVHTSRELRNAVTQSHLFRSDNVDEALAVERWRNSCRHFCHQKWSEMKHFSSENSLTIDTFSWCAKRCADRVRAREEKEERDERKERKERRTEGESGESGWCRGADFLGSKSQREPLSSSDSIIDYK